MNFLRLFAVLFVAIAIGCLTSTTEAFATSARTHLHMSLHNYELKSLTGETISLAKYKGKPVLLENVATL